MEDFISFIVKHLVESPDSVHIERADGEDGRVRYRIHVGQGDLGQIIGKEGRTAKSIRTLVVAVAARRGVRATIEIVDPARPAGVSSV